MKFLDAVDEGHIGVVDILLKKGVNINATDYVSASCCYDIGSTYC